MKVSRFLVGLGLCSLVVALATAGEKGTPEQAQALLDKAVQTVANPVTQKVEAKVSNLKPAGDGG